MNEIKDSSDYPKVETMINEIGCAGFREKNQGTIQRGIAKQERERERKRELNTRRLVSLGSDVSSRIQVNPCRSVGRNFG